MKLGDGGSRRSKRPYRRVATGGTFDHIHLGHESLLRKSFEAGEDVIIGLTSDEFVARVGKRPDFSYNKRREALELYLARNFSGRSYHISKLDDYFGPGIADPGVEALVTSPETAPRVAVANKLREEKGFAPLALIVVEWVNAEDGRPLSSTRIRLGEVDEKGRLIPKS